MKRYIAGLALAITAVLMSTIVVLAVPSTMTTFKGLPTDTTIELSWLRATGATQTLIRYKTTGYPANTADGTLVYSGTALTYTLTGLTGGATYYFSAWGYDGADYSATALNLLITTISPNQLSGGDDIPDVPAIPSMFQVPTHTGLQKLDPIYTIVNNFMTDMGITASVGWVGIILIIIGAISIKIGLMTHEPIAGEIVALVLVIFFVTANVLSGWMVAFMLLVIGGTMGMHALTGA